MHISTASRALNPSTASIVNPETVERVAEAARKLGYRPHPLARGLRTNRTMSVGVIIPDVENPLFGPIIAGVESVLVEKGYSVLIGNADRGPGHADLLVEDMLKRHVDGLILATPSRDVSDAARDAQRDVSMVLVNRSVDDDSIPAIVGDDHAGIGLAVRHLRELGHSASAMWPDPRGSRRARGGAMPFSTGWRPLGSTLMPILSRRPSGIKWSREQRPPSTCWAAIQNSLPLSRPTTCWAWAVIGRCVPSARSSAWTFPSPATTTCRFST